MPQASAERDRFLNGFGHISLDSYIAVWLCSAAMATTTFEVLAEPTRRRILELLLERSRPVGELVDQLGISQPGVSKHLRVLRDGGFVSVRADAQRRIYELHPAPLAELDAWLEPYRRLWAGRLDALERHLDASETKEGR
jgi:DNA-binding transcriptional ArsR family regulator